MYYILAEKEVVLYSAKQINDEDKVEIYPRTLMLQRKNIVPTVSLNTTPKGGSVLFRKVLSSGFQRV